MSGGGSSSGDIFDVKKIRRLVELMNEHDLTEIDLRDAGVRVRLRKHQEPVWTTVEPRSMPQPVAPPMHVAPPQATAAASSAADDNFSVIKSIMVGTFFVASSPESPPFVKVGDHVGPDTTICIIEAMKVFNEIPAGASGKIVAVLVENGDPVEFGQPLFKIDPRN